MDALPDDIASLRAALARAQAQAATAEQRAADAEARLAAKTAESAHVQAQIAALTLRIEKLQRELHGQRSERKARLLDQLELEPEELEAGASEDELAAERAAARTATVAAFVRKRPARKAFPAHLPRERVVIPAPTRCPCCGSARLCRLGETVTESAERIPASWKIIQTVREKVSCRDCERISQPPAPFHATPRGWAGPKLLATILVDKFAHHLPLDRQCERFARESLPPT